MKTFATRQSSRAAVRPTSPRSPLLSPARGLSESTAERQASQTSTRAMQRSVSHLARAIPTLHHDPRTHISQPSLFRAPGHQLDPSTRSLMESRFRFDFSRIRIHNDSPAHRAAGLLSARAFAHGSDIAFAPGQYNPSSAEGQRLLAHELAHTIQQANSPDPVIRREANLNGATTFGDRDAGKIDKVIAASPIKNYIKPEKMVPLAGNFEVKDPESFRADFKKYGKSNENVDQVPGFVYRGQDKPIRLRGPGTYNADSKGSGKVVTPASFEVAVHEAVHLNSQTSFQSYFGHHCNEGVTEYFTEQVLGESGKAYRDELAMAQGFKDAFNPGGEKQMGDAYFTGAKPLFDKAAAAFGTARSSEALRNWQTKSNSDKPADWSIANNRLREALAHPAPPQAPPKAANPSAGSGASSDVGSGSDSGSAPDTETARAKSSTTGPVSTPASDPNTKIPAKP